MGRVKSTPKQITDENGTNTTIICGKSKSTTRRVGALIYLNHERCDRCKLPYSGECGGEVYHMTPEDALKMAVELDSERRGTLQSVAEKAKSNGRQVELKAFQFGWFEVVVSKKAMDGEQDSAKVVKNNEA